MLRLRTNLLLCLLFGLLGLLIGPIPNAQAALAPPAEAPTGTSHNGTSITWARHAAPPVYTDNQIETSVTTMQYDDMGRLIRQTSSGEPDVLFTYDPLISELQYSGLDLNGDGQLTLASEDRISYGSERFLKDAATGDWWIHSVAQTFPVLNDPTPQTLSESYQRVTGHAANQIAESILIDAQGLTTSSSSVLTRGNRTTTVTTTLPDSDTPAQTRAFAARTGTDHLQASVPYYNSHPEARIPIGIHKGNYFELLGEYSVWKY